MWDHNLFSDMVEDSFQMKRLAYILGSIYFDWQDMST